MQDPKEVTVCSNLHLPEQLTLQQAPVMYHNSHSYKEYMWEVYTIEQRWLVEIAPFYKATESNASRDGEKGCSLHSTAVSGK